MKKMFLMTALLLQLCGTQAQTILFDTQAGESFRYRIPAIVKTSDNSILAISDKRYATGDIGSGRLDIVSRRLKDGVWGEEQLIIAGDIASTGFEKAHGDAAVVCDRETGRLLMMCASGAIGYGQSSRQNPLRVGRMTSDDNGETWTIEDVTDTIYAINSSVYRAFFGSGRICQSRFIKKGDYYRLYAAITTNIGSLVVYSDDFGKSWLQLGGTDSRPAKSGDEAKVEELPDKTVLLSSRMNGGRFFNTYRYQDNSFTSGVWDTVVSSTTAGGTVSTNCSCNGEILIVPAMRKSDGKDTYVALQSVPFGSGRTNVGIYWKELTSPADYDQAASYQTGWTSIEVTDTTSAYSTMVLDAKGDINFLYENVELNNGYDIVYQSFTLEGLTGNAFVYNPNPADGIRSINRDQSAIDLEDYFDLNGCRLSTIPLTGMYIHNGRIRMIR